MTAQAVLDEAMALPPVERAGLIEQLLASFDVDSRRTVDAAWASESELRLDAYEQDKIGTTALHVVRERINSQ